MKRLMLLLLLSTTAVQAADFNKTWNDVHNSRVTSAGKAVLTGVMGYYTLFAAWRNIQGFCGDISNLNCPSWRHFNNLIVHGAFAGGMSYVTYRLWWDLCRKYTQHALTGEWR